MGGFKEMLKKYRLCLILSVMAVVLVVSGLLFIKEGEEPSIKEESETIEISDVYKVEHTEPDIETESVQESVVETEETVVTEESVEPENVQTDTTEVEPENVASEAGTEEQPEDQPEDIPVESPEPESTPIPVPAPEELSSATPEPVVQEHSWIFESYFQQPDCSNGGLENQICVHCGETRTVGGTPTGKHDYIVETEGDCSSEEIVRCSVCNTREVREKNMTNHVDVEDGICYGCGQKLVSE